MNSNKQVIKDVEKTIMLRKKRETPRDVYRVQATHPRLTGRPTTSPIGRTGHGANGASAEGQLARTRSQCRRRTRWR